MKISLNLHISDLMHKQNIPKSKNGDTKLSMTYAYRTSYSKHYICPWSCL